MRLEGKQFEALPDLVFALHTGSETECIGHFKLLFSLLRVHGAGKVQQLALEVGIDLLTLEMT